VKTKGLPIAGLILTGLISAALAVAVSFWILSTKTDASRMNTVVVEIQAKIDTATETLEKINAEIIRLQSELDLTASQPVMAKAEDDSPAETVLEAKDELPAAEESQSEEVPQNADEEGEVDSPDSLFVFEGNITRHMESRMLLVSSRRQTSEFTYSNYKYVPPFVIDGTAVIELAEKHALLQKPDGSQIELYVVQDGKYEYKEAIGAIEIAKEVNKYRETNLKDPPKQQLVEFQGQQKTPGARSGLPQRGRKPPPRRQASQRPPPR
jgi:hypothetical protein